MFHWKLNLSLLFFSFILLFVAYGVALDPIQGQVFGPVLAPFLLGLVVMINIFVSAGIAEAKGYSGASMNPSRCFGAAVASGDWVIILFFLFLQNILFILSFLRLYRMDSGSTGLVQLFVQLFMQFSTCSFHQVTRHLFLVAVINSKVNL